ncbi:MAG: hypothetical protein IPL98_19535 [Saprospiraceae bacterium]|nr:hypothetical protein [Saprospiraceae bacterium]
MDMYWKMGSATMDRRQLFKRTTLHSRVEEGTVLGNDQNRLCSNRHATRITNGYIVATTVVAI